MFEMLHVMQDTQLVCRLLFSLYLLSGTVMDLREKSVPRWWLFAGGALTLTLIIYPALAGGGTSTTDMPAFIMRAAGAAAGTVFLAVAWMKPQSFGTADALLIVMIGVITGLWQLFYILMIAFSLAAFGGVIRWAVLKRREEIAFIPFLTAGFIAEGVMVWQGMV